VIDLHCHILPGVDDGAKTEQDALEMARAACAEGITHIVATPHHRNGVYENTKNEIIDQVQLLNEWLDQEGLPVTILPGQENRIQGDLVEKLEAGEILTMNRTGKYVFVEFPTSHVPRYTARIFYDLQLSGIIPVIVHPERNHEIEKSPEVLYELINNGALSQVTAASVIGKFGKKIQKLTYNILDHHLAHFIASDAHNATSRAFHLREAYETVASDFGVDYRYLLEENADLLIHGQSVNAEQPMPIKERKFLGLF